MGSLNGKYPLGSRHKTLEKHRVNMQKKILPLLIRVLALSACYLGARANDIEPGKEFYTATHIDKAVTIDGKLTEWVGVPVLADPKFAIPKGSGAKGTYVLFEPYSGGTWTGPDDQTSAVQVAWDADNVYFGFVVTDDYHENSANSAWNGDSVQLMIASSDRTKQVALYNYALGGIEGALGDIIVNHEAGPGGDPACACETQAIVSRDATTKKTIYEIKLPAASLGLTAPLKAGLQFGLGMAINDGDDGAGQAGQKGWGGLGAHSIVFGKTPGETALVTLGTNAPGVDRAFLSAINPGVDAFTFRATDKGSSIVAPSSSKLTIDGQVVTLTFKKTGDATDFTYAPKAPFASNSDHSYAIDVKDTAGNSITDSATFKTPAYALLTAADKVTADTSKPGFIWRVHQVETGQANSNNRTEQQLAGLLGNNVADPSVVGSATGAGKPGATAKDPIQFEIPTVINLDKAGGNFGNIQPDDQMPGVPGTTGSSDNIAAEIITYIQFSSAGSYTMGVSSDDGFRTTAGNVKDIFAAQLAGEFNGGRGAANSLFNVRVAEAGVYPFRTTWEQGGGDANIEWFTVDTDASGANQYHLINDAADPKSLKAYRAATGATGPAYIASVTPAVGSSDADTSTSVAATLVDGTTKVVSSSVKMTLDGATVSATATKSGATTTVSFKPTSQLAVGAPHTVTLSYNDDSTPANSRTVSWGFTTKITEKLFVAGTLFIEAEDFNYSHGQYIKNKSIGMAGKYAGGDYQDLGDGNNGASGDGSDFGIDYFTDHAASPQAVYRPNTPIGAGKRGDTAAPPAAGLDRNLFSVEVNHVVGWNDVGDWYNYTRAFPTPPASYNVYAHLASGGSDEAAELAQITSSATTATQTKKALGTFKAAATGGWDTWHIVQLKDDSSNPVQVTLGGETTLRFTVLPGNLDFDYLAFVPAPVVGTGPKFSAVQLKGNNVLVEWTGTGTLQHANDITGPWTDISGATSPRTVTPNGSREFFRLKQ